MHRVDYVEINHRGEITSEDTVAMFKFIGDAREYADKNNERLFHLCCEYVVIESE